MDGRTVRLRLAPLAILLCAAAAASQTPPAAPPALTLGKVQAAVQRLKPGEFLWAPRIAPAGPMLFIVNITTQRAILYRNGLPVAITTVSTGRAGHRTPTGVFTILEKQVEHFSSLYDDAPMPYMQRLTWGGVALHGGHLPGYPDSHGCIRLPQAFARLLFRQTHLGMTVMVVERDMLPALAPSTGPDPAAEGGSPPAVDFTWQPQRAPTGPVSIIISVADRRLVVLRNGREIASSNVGFAVRLQQPLLFMLDSTGPAGQHWTQISMPAGLEAPASPLAANDITMPPAFRQLLRSIFTSGTTVLIVPDSIGRPAVQVVIDSDIGS
jgi:hypothetical protein